jgi:membrane protease YdiL (CAAX protease family)
MTDGTTIDEASGARLVIPRWQVLVLLVGFPIAYWINSVMPWSYRLFVERDHRYFLAFGISICVLHWASLATALWFVKQAGGTPSTIGLHLRASGLALFVVAIAVVGGALIAVRHQWPIHDAPPDDWRFYYPFTLAERCLFVFMAISAGFCEEVVYRGFAIESLKGRGWRTWSAIIAGTIAFIFIHGITALFIFPLLFVVGLFYSGLYLWRKSLTPGIYLHASFNVMAVMAI